MISKTWLYHQTQEDPAYAVEWRDGTGELIDFSTGYTFTVSLIDGAGTTALTKATGIAGAATRPNITVAWSANELDLTPGFYRLHLKATVAGRDRVFKPGHPDIIQIVEL